MAVEPRTSWTKYDRKTKILRMLGVLVAAVVAVLAWRALHVRYTFVANAARNLRDLLGRMYPPNPSYAVEIVPPLVETMNIAILGTGLAIFLSLPIAYLGAENTTPNAITYAIGKFLIVGTRSVNVIIWALFFIIIFGTGALAGVLAVAFRSIGFVSKLLAEGIEEIDPGQVAAIRAVGGSPFDVVVYGIVPQVKPTFVSVATYRWDINVREATIIGFVGAGGIGASLDASIDFFQWSNVLTILIAMLGVVLVSEGVSAYLRGKTR
ncbi:phosphonate ABC transporter, permease protein PhnE [Halostagnicola sp. A-GB9-2]|uniref:phosphonate ABC transporter, permease protein PhnE n=1 Tax=Halostagnicola sp. A-GB9-2 TaxID=3048066 RepID=UPI0024BF9888|nr:phosphonate ABC transporter, permease protein PhnE [Halostagnicola sp. A-GB9-2]MDJ1433147.1 phosphonate ABC transporter, permease protein PhnE [Halostagnicola sp. A-GB9-2]